MTSTQPAKLTFREFLVEDSEDIAAGLRMVLNDLKSKWGNVGRSTDRMRDAALKKLTPAQRSKVTEQVNSFMDNLLTDVGKTPDFQRLLRSLGPADEAVAVASVFAVLGNPQGGKLQYLAQLFLNSAETKNIIDTATADRLLAQVRSDVDRPASPDVVSFFRDHGDFFKRVLDLDDNLGIDPDAGAELLMRKLTATKDSTAGTQKDAIVRTAYGLQRIRLACVRTVALLQSEALSRRPAKKLTEPEQKK